MLELYTSCPQIGLFQKLLKLFQALRGFCERTIEPEGVKGVLILELQICWPDELLVYSNIIKLVLVVKFEGIKLSIVMSVCSVQLDVVSQGTDGFFCILGS